MLRWCIVVSLVAGCGVREDRWDDTAWTPFVRALDYNARGQRTAIVYAENGAGTDGAFTTAYTSDSETFRRTPANVGTSRSASRRVTMRRCQAT